jgi:hypothetical protein
MYVLIYCTFFHVSACFIFTWPENLYPFLNAIYLDLVSYLMEPTGTGQVHVTCPVGSTDQPNLSTEISPQMLYMFEEIGSI